MSGFERLLGTGKRNLTPAEGFTGLALCAVGADRQLTTEEVEEVASRLNDLEVFSGFGKVKLLKGAKKAFEIYDDEGHHTLLGRSIEAVPSGRTREAYETVVAILAADRDVPKEEREMMNRLEEELHIGPDVADEVRRRHGVERKAG